MMKNNLKYKNIKNEDLYFLYKCLLEDKKNVDLLILKKIYRYCEYYQFSLNKLLLSKRIENDDRILILTKIFLQAYKTYNNLQFLNSALKLNQRINLKNRILYGINLETKKKYCDIIKLELIKINEKI